MERCGVHLYRGSRRSFETAHAHGEAPPRLQVIGFDVQAPAKGAGSNSASVVLRPTIKPAASSPRASALQQLLLHQSPPSTSSPSSNDHSLPPPLPPPSASSPPAAAANHMSTFTPALLPSNKPTASSSPSSNPCLPCGLLPPATSRPAANQKSTGAGLLQPPADHPNSMSSQSPSASAYHSNSSSGRLKSMLQSQCASSRAPANPSSRNSFLISVGQSQCANSSSSSSSSSGLSALNMQMINQHDPDRSKALIKENHGIKQVGDAKPTELNGENVAKAPMISATEVINELPYPDVTKSTKSSWFHGNSGRPISPAQCHDSSWKGLQQIIELPFFNEKNRKSSRNEEKSKKSSVFVLVASSPAAEFHPHHHHQAEYHASRNMDFLSSCHLCRRLLGQGQDIFMYSGDKAFCSMECRYEQIVMDERKERCPPPIIRSGASQVYQHSSVTATTTHHPIIINKPHFINTAAAA